MEKEVIKREIVETNGAFGFPEFQQLRGLVFSEIVYPPQSDPLPSSTDALFDMVYAVNPRTKLPDGDIAMFMSENTSPEIKDFIAKQLMSPNQSQSDGGKYDGLDDDAIALYTRNSDESLYDYRDRMYQVVYAQYQQRKDAAKAAANAANV